jgi:hypothetical protein
MWQHQPNFGPARNEIICWPVKFDKKICPINFLSHYGISGPINLGRSFFQAQLKFSPNKIAQSDFSPTRICANQLK